MNRLRDGNCTNDDWSHYLNLVRKYSISADEWKKSSGYDVVHIYSTDKEVSEHNIQYLKN